MNEAKLVREIIGFIKEALPRAVIFNHHDVSTAGIPDVSVTHYGGERRTTWLEVKLLEEHETPSSLRKHFDKLQLSTAWLLQGQGHAHYLVGWKSPRGLMLALMDPKDLFHMLYGKDRRLEEFVPGMFFAGARRYGPFRDTIRRIAVWLSGQERI